jgi:lipopolysaccharide assembly protein A
MRWSGNRSSTIESSRSFEKRHPQGCRFFILWRSGNGPTPYVILKYHGEYATLRPHIILQRNLLMKFVSTIVGIVLFILFFGFALKNTQEVDLHFFLQYELRGPLVLMLLAFFVAGAAFGILALAPTVFRQRREKWLNKITIQSLQSAAGTGNAAPTPDSVTPPPAPRP